MLELERARYAQSRATGGGCILSVYRVPLLRREAAFIQCSSSQCAMSTGTVIDSSIVRVTPPHTRSR
ncbi:hypothetical protein VSR34_38690, partial [Paraburkholderia sp. JHI2823]|uniref:hypothetical protein n=1 Tax=Paraburkholderia sp. JHI2823 TaxID=3112960 RepID=UPI0031715A4C